MGVLADGVVALEAERPTCPRTCTSEPVIEWDLPRKFWKVGRFEDPEAGLSLGIGWRLDKNSKIDSRAFELMLTCEGKTGAYLLVELLNGALALRGMAVYEEFRGKGLGSVLMAMWLKLCMDLKLPPATKKIDKPIISRVLHKFGFRPSSMKTAIDVSVEPGPNGEVVLWSADQVQLRSTFSKSYLKTQNMVVVAERPPMAHTVYVNTTFAPPDTDKIIEHIESALRGKSLCFYTAREGQGFVSFIEEQIARLPTFHAARTAATRRPAGTAAAAAAPRRPAAADGLAHMSTAQMVSPLEAEPATQNANIEKKDKEHSRSMAHMRTAQVSEVKAESSEQFPESVETPVPEKKESVLPLLLGSIVLAAVAISAIRYLRNR